MTRFPELSLLFSKRAPSGLRSCDLWSLSHIIFFQTPKSGAGASWNSDLQSCQNQSEKKLFYWRTSLNVGLNLGISLFVHALLGIGKYYQYQMIRSKYLFWISDTEVRFLLCWGTQVTYSSLKSSSFESSANRKLQIQIAALPSLYLYLLVIGKYSPNKFQISFLMPCQGAQVTTSLVHFLSQVIFFWKLGQSLPLPGRLCHLTRDLRGETDRDNPLQPNDLVMYALHGQRVIFFWKLHHSTPLPWLCHITCDLRGDRTHVTFEGK